MKDVIVIGVDHGYAAMKTVHFSFPTGLVEYEHEPYTQKDVLEYNGRYYVVGSGRQPLQRDKTQTEDYYLLTLAAIAKELEHRGAEHTASVHLAAGLPLTSFGRDKKSFRSYLYRDGSAIPFRYEGQDYTVTIQEVSLFPQGYAAVLTQTELLDEPSVIVADIGGWTVDLMRLDNRIPNAASCRSLELGMIRCIDEISEQVRRLFGLSMTTAQIESAAGQFRRDGRADQSGHPHPGGQVRPKPALGSHRERPGHPSHARHFPGRRSGALKTPPFGHRRPVPPAYPGRRIPERQRV